MEHDWRPRDAAERSHQADRVNWHHQTHAEQLQPKPAPAKIDKDAIFTSEEAISFDRGVASKMDPANRSWVPHEPHVPEYDLTSRSEEPKPEHFG